MSVINRLSRWIGRARLRPDEIDDNRFLKAASLFADTAIQYGRDRYSGRDMPLFADCLHTDHLKASRSMTSHRTGTEPKPAVWSFFQNQQNLTTIEKEIFMNNRIIRPEQIFNNLFMLTTIVMVCMMSVVSFSTAFADAHEMEGETAEEEPMAEKPKVTGWFQIDVDSLGTYFWVGASH